MNSKRKYRVVVLEPTSKNAVVNVDDFETTLNEIVSEKTDFEVHYTLQQIIDDVLDIPQGCSMYFQPNRDNRFSKGIIYRLV